MLSLARPFKGGSFFEKPKKSFGVVIALRLGLLGLKGTSVSVLLLPKTGVPYTLHCVLYELSGGFLLSFVFLPGSSNSFWE